ncbi:MAG: glutathione S-transferase family protein [Rubrivivax sp.]|nr:glutathione S-transferase family protein [Rubrivivax sp.]
MTITLHSWPRSSGTRVSWALEELGIAYEYVQLDPHKQEQRAAHHLALHPLGKVPALVDGEVTLFESAAILLHLGERYGIERQLWPAGTGQARADALSWTLWAMVDFGNNMMQFVYHGLDSPVSYRSADRSAACAEYNRAHFDRGLDALEERLRERPFLLGTFSLADIPAASWLQLGNLFGVATGARPRLSDWLRRCSERPACRRAR